MKQFKEVLIFSVFLTFSVISVNCVIVDKRTNNWLNNWYSNAVHLEKPFDHEGHKGAEINSSGRHAIKRSIRTSYPFGNTDSPTRSGQQEMEEFQPGNWSPNNYGWGWSPYISQSNYDKELEGSSDLGLLFGLLGLKGIKVLKALIGFGFAVKCIASAFIAFKAGIFLSPILLPFLAPAYLGALLLPFIPLLVMYLVARIFIEPFANTTTTIINNITNTTTSTTTTTTTRSPNGRSFSNDYGKEDIFLIGNVLNSENCVNKIMCDIKNENEW